MHVALCEYAGSNSPSTFLHALFYCLHLCHRYVAERGSGAQLMHVEKIDEAYNLKPLPPSLKPIPQLTAATHMDGSTEKKSFQTQPEKPLPINARVPR